MKPQKRPIGHIVEQPRVIGQPAPRKVAVTGRLRKPRRPAIRGRVVGKPIPRYGKAERVREATQ